MNIAVFLIASLLQSALAFWLASIYFRHARALREKRGAQYRVAEFALFLVFVLTVIPLCMYFPAWLGEEVAALAPTPNNRMALLALSGAGLVASLIGGWKRAHRT